MNRRAFLLSAAALTGATALGGVATLRLHLSPRTDPFLTPEHLAQIAATDLPRPRVLFVGNSMVLRHDVPARLAGIARAEGHQIAVATAAANGARLIETLRIAELRLVLKPDYWDAVILQDFTETPLRAPDRWGSAIAMTRIARQVAPAPILLYPPWPGDHGHPIYKNAGRLKAQPENPSDYAARTMAHYTRVSRKNGFDIAPVPQRWLEAVAEGEGLYDKDRHHANAHGAALVARILWESLKPLLNPSS